MSFCCSCCSPSPSHLAYPHPRPCSRPRPRPHSPFSSAHALWERERDLILTCSLPCSLTLGTLLDRLWGSGRSCTSHLVHCCIAASWSSFSHPHRPSPVCSVCAHFCSCICVCVVAIRHCHGFSSSLSCTIFSLSSAYCYHRHVTCGAHPIAPHTTPVDLELPVAVRVRWESSGVCVWENI